jgi:hypothetical protein
VDPSFRPRKQRLRKMSEDKAEGARNEVKRILRAGVIREAKYPVASQHCYGKEGQRQIENVH